MLEERLVGAFDDPGMPRSEACRAAWSSTRASRVPYECSVGSACAPGQGRRDCPSLSQPAWDSNPTRVLAAVHGLTYVKV